MMVSIGGAEMLIIVLLILGIPIVAVAAIMFFVRRGRRPGNELTAQSTLTTSELRTFISEAISDGTRSIEAKLSEIDERLAVIEEDKATRERVLSQGDVTREDDVDVSQHERENRLRNR